MATNNTQLRGNCQCCGRFQAVQGRFMAKHGYTVEQGWFRGVCQGHSFAPMQHERTMTDRVVASVREEVAGLLRQADKLEAGTATLGLVADPSDNTYRGRGEEQRQVQWSSLPSYYQQRVLDSAVWNLRQRAKAGTTFADGLQSLADKLHGTALEVVARPQAPAPIATGERRILVQGTIAAVRYVHGARVYWCTDRGQKGWTGTQAWRKLPLAEG